MPGPPSRLALADRVVLVVVLNAVLGLGALVGIAYVGIDSLSAIRAFVGGEALWSKAQKDAVHHLMRYAVLGDEDGYVRFLEELELPLGDRRAREALDRPDPDRAAAREGLLAGANHPDDVDRMIRFFLRFRQVPYVHRATAVWEEGDAAIDELIELGERIRLAVEEGSVDDVRAGPMLGELNDLNARLTILEAEFSSIFGDAARWAHRMVTSLLVLLSGFLLFLITGVTWTVTRRLKRSQASLLASERRYRDLYEQSPFGVYRSTLDGRILSANPALVELLGYPSEDELSRVDLGRDVYVDPDLRAELIRRSLADESQLLTCDAEWRRVDGEVVVVRLNGRLFRGPTGAPEGYEMFVEDVTERRTLEGQLRQAQKMEALGQLTGGIAHDFNNLLTVILAASQLLQESLGEEADALEELTEIRTAADRGAEMVRKLLAFSRRGTLKVRPTDLEALLEGMHGMLTRLLPTSIEMRVAVPGRLPPVLVDPGAVEQMLLNLATNARDAMPVGGTLLLEAEPAAPDGEALPPSAPPGMPFVCLKVIDSGIGMPPEVLDRIFEPFFTTKPIGVGTGLGLPMIYGLAWQQGAVVDVRSEPGVGTEVRLYFRSAEALDPGSREPGATERAGEPPEARTILLDVRAEPTRRALEAILEGAGFQVIAAVGGGPEGKLPDGRTGGVDLIVRDAPDPREDEPDSAAEHPSHPGADHPPILLLGGYSATDSEPAVPRAGGRVSVLHRPWSAAELLRRVGRLIGGGSARPDR